MTPATTSRHSLGRTLIKSILALGLTLGAAQAGAQESPREILEKVEDALRSTSDSAFSFPVASSAFATIRSLAPSVPASRRWNR